MRINLVVLIILVVFGSESILAQFGAEVSEPVPLNTNAAIDSGIDSVPKVSTDGAGNWVAVWDSQEPAIGGGIGTDQDVLVARSTDNGVSWTAPQVLNTSAGSDSGNDGDVQLATDGSGNWVVVWTSDEPAIGGGIGTDRDILFARSTDNGLSWTPPQALNAHATIDSAIDDWPALSTDGAGIWVAVWRSYESAIGPGIGGDADILFSRSTNNGASWTYPEPLNANAYTDGDSEHGPVLGADGSGNWVAVWHRMDADSSGETGRDWDIFVARSSDDGANWSYPEPLNANAYTDIWGDVYPCLSTDSAGNWIAVWESEEPAIDGGIGTDRDILVARSTDNGANWTYPEALNTNAGTDNSHDYNPYVTTDASDNWVAMWEVQEIVIGADRDVFVARSTDNGGTWTQPELFNTNADTDRGDEKYPELTPDGSGNWVAVWYSTEAAIAGGIGADQDILTSRFVFYCDAFADDSVYGIRLFSPLCTRDASDLPQDLYGAVTTGINKGQDDLFYLSSNGMSFAALVVDDAIHVNGVGSGLGPYSLQPGVVPPDYLMNVPIEHNLVPLPAHAISDLFPVGASDVLFELLDTQRAIYGHTAVYLVRDCGIYLGKEPDTTLHWLSHDVEVNAFQSNLNVVSGMISELRSDQDFSRACDLGSLIDSTQAIDSRPDPSSGDGYYYLVSGTCAQPIGYGYSSLVPDPRGAIETASPPMCP